MMNYRDMHSAPVVFGPDAVAGVQRRNLADALFKAVIRCRFQRVKFLMDNGVSPLVVNDGNQNLLIAALYIVDVDKRDHMFRYLVRRGADCCFIDRKTGRDVTSWAAILGHSKQVQCIFESVVGEVDLHAKDKDGMTPLHHAVATGHLDTVKVLIKYMRKYDLSLDIPDSQGLSPYIYARRFGYTSISNALISGCCSTEQFDTMTYRTADQWAEIGRQERRQHMLKVQEMEKIGLIQRTKQPSPIHHVKLPALKITSSDTDKGVVIRFTEPKSSESAGTQHSGRSVSPITIVGEPELRTKRIPTPSPTTVISEPDSQIRHDIVSTPLPLWQKPAIEKSYLSAIDYRLRADTKLLLSLQHMSASTQTLNQQSSNECMANIMGIVAQQCTHTFRPSVKPPKPKKPSNKTKFNSLAFVLRAGKKRLLKNPPSTRSSSPALSEKRVGGMTSFMGAFTTTKGLMEEKRKKKLPPIHISS